MAYNDPEESLSIIKAALRESEIPYFTDKEILYQLERAGGDTDLAIYELLIVKSEDSTIEVSGLSTEDTSGYFKRLASRYKPFNSRLLESDG